MNQSTLTILAHWTPIFEGQRTKPYLDTAKPPRVTIGIGRNLTDKGLSNDEIQYLFSNDLKEAEREAVFVLGAAYFDALSPPRQACLIDLAFNMGQGGLASFTNTLQAIRDGNYTMAAVGLRSSRWAHQVQQQRVDIVTGWMENG